MSDECCENGVFIGEECFFAQSDKSERRLEKKQRRMGSSKVRIKRKWKGGWEEDIGQRDCSKERRVNNNEDK